MAHFVWFYVDSGEKFSFGTQRPCANHNQTPLFASLTTFYVIIPADSAVQHNYETAYRANCVAGVKNPVGFHSIHIESCSAQQNRLLFFDLKWEKKVIKNRKKE